MVLTSGEIRVYGQFCIEMLHERYNGIERLVVCLSEYLPLRRVYILVIKSSGVCFAKRSRIAIENRKWRNY